MLLDEHTVSDIGEVCVWYCVHPFYSEGVTENFCGWITTFFWCCDFDWIAFCVFVFSCCWCRNLQAVILSLISMTKTEMLSHSLWICHSSYSNRFYSSALKIHINLVNCYLNHCKQMSDLAKDGGTSSFGRLFRFVSDWKCSANLGSHVLHLCMQCSTHKSRCTILLQSTAQAGVVQLRLRV